MNFPPMQYIISIALIIVGIWAILFKRNLLKILICLNVVDSGVNLFLITLGYRSAINGKIPTAPIYTGYEAGMRMVGPLPQALVLTAIVIGVSVLALAVALVIRVYDQYGSLDASEVRRLRG